MIRKLVEPNKYHPKKNSKIMSPPMPTTTFHPTPLVTFTTRNCSRRKSLQRNMKSEYYTPSCQLPISPTSREIVNINLIKPGTLREKCPTQTSSQNEVKYPSRKFLATPLENQTEELPPLLLKK